MQSKQYSIYRWSILVSLLVGTAGCFNNEEAQRVDPISPGTADFTRYVAVGNSLTAGFMDGGLYRDGQLNSYPYILSQQFRLVGGRGFIQPLFSTDQANGTGYLKLTSLPTATNPLPTIVPVAPQAVRGLLNNRPLYTKFTGTNNNLGVPGIRMGDIQTPGYGSPQGNPYFERLLPDGTPLRTYLQYVSDNLTGATFFSCFMGNNDALGYATSGGVVPFTPTPLFTTNYNALLDVLTASGRKGVVIGIPKVTTAPFFQVVTLAQVLAGVNAAVQKANPGAPAIPALVIESPLATGGIRATKAGDLLLLSQQADYATIGSTAVGTKKGPYGLSALNPLSNASVLDAEEVAALSAKIDEYNAILKAQADSRTLAYVDLTALNTQLSATGGYVQNGLAFSSNYVSGGVFGLDGIHFTAAGYALLANEILKSIGTTYKASIPAVDPTRYRKVLVQP
ncbi:SGNH/GDSL hydrolase family protein [Fibrella sp. HMF5335]|uniref:SGNH/GDSL hydrolase family protein n=1 Tax=Fibrella rubiginis TaxID=2817060 RepID=A0A939GMG0_9BACT|nr:SGNH/GDSL hydrolase family protein [Fibrella rubiginis]MBO0939486.1 SGNH/GDSL hydrolase family protein [Fibrella rubiginis]